MWTFRRCLPEHANIIAVEAPLPDPIGGFSWWPIEHSEWESGAMLAYQTLARFLENVCAYYNLTPSKRLALGFSQGGGLLSLLVQRLPHTVDAVAFLASFVIRDSALAAPPLPALYFAHGEEDLTVPIDKAREGAQFLEGKGFTVEFASDPVGHKVGAGGMRQLKAFIEKSC